MVPTAIKPKRCVAEFETLAAAREHAAKVGGSVTLCGIFRTFRVWVQG